MIKYRSKYWLKGWISNEKVLGPVSKLIKIPSQKDNLLLFIEELKEIIVEKLKGISEDVSMVLQAM